jgi:hypothetical protein
VRAEKAQTAVAELKLATAKIAKLERELEVRAHAPCDSAPVASSLGGLEQPHER